MAHTKVLIGVPGFAGVVPRAQEDFAAFVYRCGRDNPAYDFYLKIVTKREQFRARNALVDLAMVNDCEYLFMLDDDMIVPPDLFARLVAHNKDVVGALYYQRGGAYHPVLMRQHGKKDDLIGVEFVQPFDTMIREPGLYPIDIIGGGCMLIKTDVFRKLLPPYFWVDGIVGTDVYLCHNLRKAGVEIFVDTSIELGHVGEESIVTSRTIPHYSKVLGEEAERLWKDLQAFYVMNDLQLESELTRADAGRPRSEAWHAKDRSTWEGVRAYYQEAGTWAVFNLAAYNLRYDASRDWAINQTQKLLPPGSTVVDYGCGIGACSLPLAKQGYKVMALDVAGAATREFFLWRRARYGLSLQIVPLHFDEPVPPVDLQEPADLTLMISVLDHLWDPYGALAWVTRNTRPGGYFFCDTWRTQKMADEPQHLVRYDPLRILQDLRAMGWADTPDNPFLFRRRR